jgi:hypothetical protein
MKYNSLAKGIILEGGNVFSSTSSISQDLIPEALHELHQQVLAPLNLVKKGKDWDVLGSVGKKPVSNDIDVAVVKSIPEIEQYIKSSGYQYRNLTGLDIMSIAFPFSDSHVQVDLMSTNNLPYSIWSYHSPSGESKYSGTYRNAMLEAIASEMDKHVLSHFSNGGVKKQKKMYFSYSNGLMERIDTYKGKRGKPIKKPITLERSLISKDPKRISEILLGEGTTRDDTDSFESIYNKIMGESFPHKSKINDIKEKCVDILTRKNLPIPEELKESPKTFKKFMKSKKIVNMPKIPHIENMTVPQIKEFFNDGDYEISEKLDGANFSVGAMDDTVYGKSKKDKERYDANYYHSNSHINDVFDAMGNLLKVLSVSDFVSWHDSALVDFGSPQMGTWTLQIFGEIFNKKQVNLISYPDASDTGTFVVFGIYLNGGDITNTIKGQRYLKDFVEKFNSDKFNIRYKMVTDCTMCLDKVSRLMNYINNNHHILTGKKRDDEFKETKASVNKTMHKLLKAIRINLLNQMVGVDSMLGGDVIEGLVVTNKRNNKMIKIVDVDKFAEENTKIWADRNGLKVERRYLFSDMMEFLNSDVLKLKEKRESTLRDYLTLSGKAHYENEEELLAVLINDINEEININQSLSGISSTLKDYSKTLFRLKDSIDPSLDEKSYNDTLSMFNSELDEVLGIIDSIEENRSPQVNVIKYVLGQQGLNNLKEMFIKA